MATSWVSVLSRVRGCVCFSYRNAMYLEFANLYFSEKVFVFNIFPRSNESTGQLLRVSSRTREPALHDSLLASYMA